jgi:hypothetical protein
MRALLSQLLALVAVTYLLAAEQTSASAGHPSSRGDRAALAEPGGTGTQSDSSSLGSDGSPNVVGHELPQNASPRPSGAAPRIALVANFVISLSFLVHYVLRARLIFRPRSKGAWPSTRGNAFILMCGAVACWVATYALRAFVDGENWLARYLFENLNSALYLALAFTLLYRIEGKKNLILASTAALISSVALTMPFIDGLGEARCADCSSTFAEISIALTAAAFIYSVRSRNWALACGLLLASYALLQSRSPEWELTHPNLLFYGLAMLKLFWLRLQLDGLLSIPGHGQEGVPAPASAEQRRSKVSRYAGGASNKRMEAEPPGSST